MILVLGSRPINFYLMGASCHIESIGCYVGHVYAVHLPSTAAATTPAAAEEAKNQRLQSPTFLTISSTIPEDF